MTPKILSQSGDSLADMYDVEGSIAGIEHLETHDLPIVHELGSTLFSERFSVFTRRAGPGAIAQNTTWDIEITDAPFWIYRVLGVVVIANAAGRVQFCQAALRDPVGGREMPFFVWDTANDSEANFRTVEDGAAVANQLALIPSLQMPPVMNASFEQPQRMPNIVFRGQTGAFGAGTVTPIMLVTLGFTHLATSVSSRGIPVPGW